MAFLGLTSFAALALLLILSIVPHESRVSSRGFSGRNIEPPANGICASFIIVNGYKCQEHEVTTNDGYILSLQRILEGQGKSGGSGSRKQPVILQHGVLVDGITWFMNHPKQNLPSILADNGFDVWIANSRGTTYSSRHTSLDPSGSAFWDWSWDELVSYDLPAMFNYVFSQTGQKINYVGHSLGTLTVLASFSEGKLINQVKSAALLSPIAFLSHMNTTLVVIAARCFAGEILNVFGLAEFNPHGLLAQAFLKSLCAYPGIDCYDLMTAMTGLSLCPNCKNCCLNSSTIDLFLTNEPQSTSTKNLVHLAQTVRDGVLRKYNYVKRDYNIMHYGKESPPIYNLSNIPHDLPLFISYGGKDALSDVCDVQNLLDKLKFHDEDKCIVQFIKEYAHVDFIMGFNAKDMVYNAVLSFFNSQVN